MNHRIGKFFIFRPIETKEELRDYFNLRYEILSSIHYLGQKNEEKLDIDKFDPSAIHFGCFLAEANGEMKLVATFRIVVNEVQEQYQNWINEILNEKEGVSLQDSALKSQGVHLLKDHVNIPKRREFSAAEAVDIDDIIRDYRENNISYCECSKLTVRPNYKRKGATANITVLFAIAYMRSQKRFQRNFVICKSRLLKYYKRFGWEYIDREGFVGDDPIRITINEVDRSLDDKKLENIINKEMLPSLEKGEEVVFAYDDLVQKLVPAAL